MTRTNSKPPNGAPQQPVLRRPIGALLRPGKVRRTIEEPCMIRVDRFRRWRRVGRLMQRPDRGAGLDVEIVFAAVTERGATFRGTLADVLAMLLRLRRRCPLGLARQIPIDAATVRRLLRAVRPAMVAGPNGALRLNPNLIRLPTAGYSTSRWSG